MTVAHCKTAVVFLQTPQCLFSHTSNETMPPVIQFNLYCNLYVAKMSYSFCLLITIW